MSTTTTEIEVYNVSSDLSLDTYLKDTIDRQRDVRVTDC